MKLSGKGKTLTIAEVESLVNYFEKEGVTKRDAVIPSVNISGCKAKVEATFGTWNNMLFWLGFKEAPVQLRYSSCEGCGNYFSGVTKVCSRSCDVALRYKKGVYVKDRHHCKYCSSSVDTDRDFCNKLCMLKNNMEGVHLADALTSGKLAAKFGNIRCRARSLAFEYLPYCCELCGYKHHVEVCHINPLSTTKLDTPLSEVNNIRNLTVLCPNHHWELDNNIITVKDIPRFQCSYYKVT